MKIKNLGLLVLTVLLFGCATGMNSSGSSKEWAVLSGYFSAQFGMNEQEVLKAIKDDFGIRRSRISRVTHPTEKTVSLGINVERLLPNSGPAKVFYILGHKSKRLIHVNVIWGKPATPKPDAENVVATANQLRNHLAQKSYQKEGLALNAQLSEGVILVFQGLDKKGRAVKLVLVNPKGGPEKIGKNISLTLSYIEKPHKPDVFRIGDKWLPPKQSSPEEEREKQEGYRFAEENRKQQPPPQLSEEPAPPQSGTGSGFFVSKMGHVITNAHVVDNCNKVTVGDSDLAQ